jgi:hypothetical protein
MPLTLSGRVGFFAQLGADLSQFVTLAIGELHPALNLVAQDAIFVAR